jgi:hypothetical protein
VLSFLQTAGVNYDDESATAAVAVILLPPDQARRFVAAFGLPPELVPTLVPSPIGIMDDQLFRIVNQGSRPQASSLRRCFSPGTAVLQGGATAPA